MAIQKVDVKPTWPQATPEELEKAKQHAIIEGKAKTKAKRLTVKESKLVKGVAEGKSKLKAATDAGYLPNATDETRRVEAHKTLQKPHVQEALEKALAVRGITIDKIVAPVAEALEYENPLDPKDQIEVRLKGHDRGIKIIRPQGTPNGGGTNVFVGIINNQKGDYDL